MFLSSGNSLGEEGCDSLREVMESMNMADKLGSLRYQRRTKQTQSYKTHVPSRFPLSLCEKISFPDLHELSFAALCSYAFEWKSMNRKDSCTQTHSDDEGEPEEDEDEDEDDDDDEDVEEEEEEEEEEGEGEEEKSELNQV